MQHVVDVANYRFPTSLYSINLLSYLKGQPLRFMAVDIDTQQHLWNLEVRGTPSHDAPIRDMLHARG